MPNSEASRYSKVTRTTTTTDFSAIIRHAHHQHLSSLPLGNRSRARNHSTLGAQTVASSFRQSLDLVSRIPVAPRARFVIKCATLPPAPIIKPRFDALTLPVIFGRMLLLLWIGARLAALILDGGARAFGKFVLHQSQLLAARRPALEAAPMFPNMDASKAVLQIEQQAGSASVSVA